MSGAPKLDETEQFVSIKSAILDAKFRYKLKKEREIKDQNTNMLIRLMEIENRSKAYNDNSSNGFIDQDFKIPGKPLVPFRSNSVLSSKCNSQKYRFADDPVPFSLPNIRSSTRLNRNSSLSKSLPSTLRIGEVCE